MKKIGITFKGFVIAMLVISFISISCISEGGNGNGNKAVNTDVGSEGATAAQEFNVNDFIGGWKSDDGWYMHFTYQIENEDDNAVFIHNGIDGRFLQAGGTDDFAPNEFSAYKFPHHALGYVPNPGYPGFGARDGGDLYFNVSNQTIIYDNGYEQRVFKRVNSSGELSKIVGLMYEKVKALNKLEEEKRQVIKNNPWLFGRWVLRDITIEFKENGTVWEGDERLPFEFDSMDNTCLNINLGGDGPTVDLNKRTIEFGGYFKKR